MFIEYRTKHDADSAYGVCISYIFLNFSAVSMNTLKFKHVISLTNCLVGNIIKFRFICLWGGKFCTSLDGSRILGIIGIN